MTNLDEAYQQEPEPTIVIHCQRVPVSGAQMGAHVLQPRLSLTNIPGDGPLEAWTNVHNLLLQSLQIVQQQITKAAQGQAERRIAVVPSLPADYVRH